MPMYVLAINSFCYDITFMFLVISIMLKKLLY